MYIEICSYRIITIVWGWYRIRRIIAITILTSYSMLIHSRYFIFRNFSGNIVKLNCICALSSTLHVCVCVCFRWFSGHRVYRLRRFNISWVIVVYQRRSLGVHWLLMVDYRSVYTSKRFRKCLKKICDY